MRCGDPTYEQMIEQKVGELVEGAALSKSDDSGEIVLQFFTTGGTN
jgi:hypothetical protein